MIRALRVLPVLVLAGVTLSAADSPLIRDAVAAMGGLPAIQAIHVLVMEGGGMANNLGQARTPQGDDPVAPEEPTSTFEVTGFKRTLDFANHRARQQWKRAPKFASPNPDGVQNAGLDGGVAYTIGANNQYARQGDDIAKARRFELLLGHPIGILMAAMEPGVKVSAPRRQGNNDVVDITTTAGDSVTLAVDRTTHLPASVSMAADQPYLGDVTLSTEFLDYQTVNGVKLPAHFVTKIGNWKETDITVKNAVNGQADDLAAPAAVKSAAPAPGGQNLSTVNAEEVAKGVWFLTGASENSMLVEFSDHTELVEAPLGVARAQALFAKAKELVPSKPLTRVIVTHAHFDHSGGIRGVIAEGLTIVTHEANKTWFEQMARRPHSLVPDALSKNPKAPKFDLVTNAGKIEKDSMRTMQILHFDDPTGHNAYMLMVYLPNEKILFNADLFNWDGNFVRYPREIALDEAMRKNNLDVQIHLPVHGKRGTKKDFDDVLAAVKAGTTPPGLALLGTAR